MPATTSDARRPGSRRGGRGWGPPSAPIVGSRPDGRDLLPPPRPRDRRLLLLLRAADLPRLHDPDPGRHALPGVRRQRTKVVRGVGGAPRSAGAFPATFVLIAINVVVYLLEVAAGGGGFSLSGGTRSSTTLPSAAPSVADGEWYRLVTGGFLHAEPAPHRLQHDPALLPRPAAGAGARNARASSPSTSPRCSPAPSGRCCSPTPTASRSAPRVRSSACSAPTFVIARGRGIDALACQIGFLIVINLVFTFGVRSISVGAHLGGLVGGVLCALAIVAGERGCARRAPGAGRAGGDGRGRRRSRSSAPSPSPDPAGCPLPRYARQGQLGVRPAP